MKLLKPTTAIFRTIRILPDIPRTRGSTPDTVLAAAAPVVVVVVKEVHPPPPPVLANALAIATLLWRLITIHPPSVQQG